MTGNYPIKLKHLLAVGISAGLAYLMGKIGFGMHPFWGVVGTISGLLIPLSAWFLYVSHFSTKNKEDEELKEETTPAVSLEYGNLDQIDKICYAALEEHPSYLVVDDMYVRTLYVSGYPEEANANWLTDLINFDGDIDVSLHFEGIEKEQAAEDLKRKITELETQRRHAVEKGQLVTTEIEHPLESSRELRDKLVKGTSRLFNLSLYVSITAGDLYTLEQTTLALRNVLSSKYFYVKTAYYQQIPGFDSVLPRVDNQLKMRRNLDSESVAMTFPFVSSELADENGILYGVNKSNNSLVIFDRFSLPNYNATILARSGAGKSYAAKLEILRYLMVGTRVIVIDREGEYRHLCEKVNGAYIELGVGAQHRINPFDIPRFEKGDNEDSFVDHIRTVSDLLALMMEGGLTPIERASLEQALEQTYREWGVEEEGKASIFNKDKSPLLANIYQILNKEMREKDLAKRLRKYVEGHLSSLFDKPTNVDIDNRLVIFHLKNLKDKEKDPLLPILMFVIANFVWHRIENYPGQKKILVLDEAWTLLEQAESARFIAGLVRRARKRWLGVTIISQDVEDLTGDKLGRVILSQSATNLLFKQSDVALDRVQEIFHLSGEERKLLQNSQPGEAVLIADENHISLKIEASPDEDPVITTDPMKRYMLDRKKIEKEKTSLHKRKTKP